MAEQNPKKKPQASSPSDLNGKDVNSLLDSAQKSLEAVEQELGKETPSKSPGASAKESPELSGTADIDSTLAELEKEIGLLDSQTDTEDSPASPSAVVADTPAAMLASKKTEVGQPVPQAEDIDNILGDLSSELEKLDGSSPEGSASKKEKGIPKPAVTEENVLPQAAQSPSTTLDSNTGQTTSEEDDQDVDSLLAGLADELQEEDTIVAQAGSAANTKDIIEDSVAESEADEILSDLAEDLASLNEATDAPSASTPAVEEVEIASEIPQAGEPIDDVLASLASELSEDEAEVAEPQRDSVESPPIKAKEELEPEAVAEEAKSEPQSAATEIDQLLAEAESDLKQADQEDADSSVATPEEKSDTELPQGKTSDKRKASEQDASFEDEDDGEPKIKTLADDPDGAKDTPEAEEEAEEDKEETSLENFGSEPVAETVSTESPTEAPPQSISHNFPVPQRLLINMMVATNKPFGFVKPSMKEILGLIAVITCMISMLGVGIILLFM